MASCCTLADANNNQQPALREWGGRKGGTVENEIKCPFCGLHPFGVTEDGETVVDCCRKGDLTIAHGFSVAEAEAIVDHGMDPLKVIRMRNVVKVLHDDALDA